jgi:hypothetical protein
MPSMVSRVRRTSRNEARSEIWIALSAEKSGCPILSAVQRKVGVQFFLLPRVKVSGLRRFPNGYCIATP